jgi:hypothetical protein
MITASGDDARRTTMTAPAAPVTPRGEVVIAWWPPVVGLITLMTVAVAMVAITRNLISPQDLQLLTGCTSEPVADAPAPCPSTQGWELAGTVGQVLLASAAVIAVVVAIRRPASRLRILCAGVLGLPLSLAWAVIMVFAATGTAAAGNY